MTGGIQQARRQGRFEACVAVDPGKSFGRIDPAIYGQYLEHVEEMDECIYPSLWDDRSPFADENGLRRDAIIAAREMGVPIVRWPGGCFADVYHWENGIGPRASRPELPNKHWGGKESHQFGTDEFLSWCEEVGSRAYINVNLGSGTLDEALRWLEYCNGPKESRQGKIRASNGRSEPFGVTFWGIGNETWAPWETGQMDAPTYARTLAEWARAMKEADPSIKILAVGSNAAKDPEWDREVLTQAGHLIDYITLHIYGSSTAGVEDSHEGVIFTPDYMDVLIKSMLRRIDEAKRRLGFSHEIRIAVDEWNIRRFLQEEGSFHEILGRREPKDVADMLFVAGMFNTFLRNSPRVAMANYVFLVNGHAPLLVSKESIVKTPLFYIFKKYAEWMQGTSLATDVVCPSIIPAPPRTGGPKHTEYPAGFARRPLPVLDAAAAMHDDGSIVLSLVNRHQRDVAEVSLNLPEGYRAIRAWTLGADDKHATNRWDDADRVVPEETPILDEMPFWRCPPGHVTLLFFKRF